MLGQYTTSPNRVPYYQKFFQAAPELLVFQKTPGNQTQFKVLMVAATSCLFFAATGVANMHLGKGKIRR
eukprot:m.14602 g.14602  ORF g.14602 m.14602 type:complete len:69 (+) comp5166_c0_seq1:140-346(+)